MAERSGDPDDRASEVERELDLEQRDTAVATRVFLFVGVAIGVMSLIYLLTDDDAGQMMLGTASLFALVAGGFLWRHRAGSRAAVIDEAPHDPRRGPDSSDMYLPHASIWPFWIGVAVLLVTNGLALGVWFVVPGVLLLAIGIVGFVAQSRTRA